MTPMQLDATNESASVYTRESAGRLVRGMDNLTTLTEWLPDALGSVTVDVERARALVRDAMQRLFHSFTELKLHLVEERLSYESAIQAITGSVGSEGLVQVLREVLSRFINDILRISQSGVKILMQIENLRTNAELVAARGHGIEAIAGTTRVLALNARIEAHRAGAAGAVFRVVADEVKSLANESRTLSEAIREAIALQSESLHEVGEAARGLVSGDLDFIASSKQRLDETLDRLTTVSQTSSQALDRIQRDIDLAIQALQFEDMLDQLLGAVSGKLAAIGSVCRGVAHGEPLGNLGARLNEVDEGLKRQSVTQSSVGTGTVELF